MKSKVLAKRAEWLNTIKADVFRSEHPEELEGWLEYLAAQKPASILEIGTRTASNLYMMASAVLPSSIVEAVDLTCRHGKQRNAVVERLQAEGHQAKIYDDTDSNTLHEVETATWEYDMIYIDGGHTYKQALNDWKQAMIRIAPRGTIGFHDIAHYNRENRERCAAFWADLQQHINRSMAHEWVAKGPTPEQPKPMGIGALTFKGRVLFMANGGLGDAAQATRAMLAATKLGYNVHVYPIAGLAKEMEYIWAKIPWITQVSKDLMKRLHYDAVICPTSKKALEERTADISADLITAGRPTGNLREDWYKCVEELAPGYGYRPLDPLAYLLEEKSKTKCVIAPGVGSAIKKIEAGGADKRYDKWQEVANYLPGPVVFVGTGNCHEDWMNEYSNMTGKTKHVDELIPILAEARCVFAPDNGIGHFSRLFGVPVVSVFNGTTDPQRFAPEGAVVTKAVEPQRVAGRLHDAEHPELISTDEDLLSIIITTHNEGTEVSETAWDYHLNSQCLHEIIIVDEGSNDGSCHPDLLPVGTKIIRNDKRRGVAPARNQGKAIAEGNAFLFLDAHMRTKPGTPAAMLRAAKQYHALINPGIAALYSHRKPIHTNTWKFSNGRIASAWKRELNGSEMKIANSFVAPGWVLMRREWERMGDWPNSLTEWGSTEVTKSLQAYMAEVPIMTCGDFIMWHRFRGRFPYSVKTPRIFRNAYVCARVMFGEELFSSSVLPVMKTYHWSNEIAEYLESEAVMADAKEAERHRRRNPKEFFDTFFPEGLPCKTNE